MLQCSGTTRTGQRCKIKAPASLTCSSSLFFCHHHQQQQSSNSLDLAINGIANLSLNHQKQRKAFIYAYTLDPSHSNVHVLSSSTNKFTPLVSSSSSKWWDFKSRSKIKGKLIKVGYTTQTPEIRLAQWKVKCKHPITLLCPPSSSHGFDHTLKGWPIPQKHSNPLQVEAKIHQNLWSLFGKGTVQCQGCVTSTSANNIHLEWFLIPDNSKALATVYSLIHSCINN